MGHNIDLISLVLSVTTSPFLSQYESISISVQTYLLEIPSNAPLGEILLLPFIEITLVLSMLRWIKWKINSETIMPSCSTTSWLQIEKATKSCPSDDGGLPTKAVSTFARDVDVLKPQRSRIVRTNHPDPGQIGAAPSADLVIEISGVAKPTNHHNHLSSDQHLIECRRHFD